MKPNCSGWRFWLNIVMTCFKPYGLDWTMPATHVRAMRSDEHCRWHKPCLWGTFCARWLSRVLQCVLLTPTSCLSTGLQGSFACQAVGLEAKTFLDERNFLDDAKNRISNCSSLYLLCAQGEISSRCDSVCARFL